MGTVLQAACECGYESEPVYVGYSMESSVPNAAGFCENCEKVVTIFNDDYVCRDCGGEIVAYEPPGNEKDEDDLPFIDSSDWLLDKPEWYCPVCKNHTLQFLFSGLWD